MLLQRHDMVLLKDDVARRIARELLEYHHIDEQQVMSSEWYLLLLAGLIPGIVRRGDDQSKADKGLIPIGISLPLRKDEQRLRFANWIDEKDILRVITPDQIPSIPFYSVTKSLSVLEALLQKQALAKSCLGVWGANALQVVTGLSYTDEKSDLDIIVYSNDKDELYKIYQLISMLEKVFLCRIDAEVQLSNHYGVGLKELFHDSSYVLGKSLTDVVLLNKAELAIC